MFSFFRVASITIPMDIKVTSIRDTTLMITRVIKDLTVTKVITAITLIIAKRVDIKEDMDIRVMTTTDMDMGMITMDMITMDMVTMDMITTDMIIMVMDITDAKASKKEFFTLNERLISAESHFISYINNHFILPIPIFILTSLFLNEVKT